MKRKIKELKRIARGNLQGHYLDVIRVFVFCDIIISLVEMPFSLLKNEITFSSQNIIYYLAIILISIASVVLNAGVYRYHLTLARTGESHPAELFIPVKYHSNRFILTECIMFGISLVAMLPMFGGIAIIYLYEDLMLYALALVLSLVSIVLTTYIIINFELLYFVMNDNENLSMLKALKYTKKLMMAHRKRYLYLQFSFLGMMFLSLLSFGIATFWVQPYMVQTMTIFYLDVKGELDEILENRKTKGPTPEPAYFNQYV